MSLPSVEQFEAHGQELYDALVTFVERVTVGQCGTMEIVRPKAGDFQKAIKAIVRWERKQL